jgi:chromosome segregation ATPase
MDAVLTEKETIENELGRFQQLNQELQSLCADKDKQLSEKENRLSELQALSAEKDKQLAEKESKLSELQIAIEEPAPQETKSLFSQVELFPNPQSSPGSRISESVVDSFMNWEDGQEKREQQKSPVPDWWTTAFGADEDPGPAPVLEEPVKKKRAFLTHEDEEEEAQQAKAKVFELGAQLTEVQTSLEVANTQVSNLNSALENVSYENSRLQDENVQLKRETEALKEKVITTESLQAVFPLDQGMDEKAAGQTEQSELVKNELATQIYELQALIAEKDSYNQEILANHKAT